MRRVDENRFLRTLSRACACLLLSTTFAFAVDARSTTHQLNIPSQALDGALQALALVSQHKLFYDAALVRGKTAPALKGQFTTEEAVKRLLSGTNLHYEVTDDGLVMIRPASASPPSSRPHESLTKRTCPRSGSPSPTHPPRHRQRARVRIRQTLNRRRRALSWSKSASRFRKSW